MKKVLIATQNAGKVEDFREMFEHDEIEVLSLLDLDTPIDDVEETGVTFAENAILKAETISEKMGIPVLADDSGLSIDYLAGRPGVYSARYAGMAKDDDKNNQKVLLELKGVSAEKRTAKFICALAFAVPGEETVVKQGECSGLIATESVGEHGFGYDPIFIPEGYGQTMGQLSLQEKNKISHRAQALKKLAAWIELEKKVGF